MTGEVKAAAALRRFIGELRDCLGSGVPLDAQIASVKESLARLLAQPGWLPEPARAPDRDGYARHLLYREAGDGFVLVAMVWGPGQATAIHDHAGVWCVEGVYEGLVEVTRYELREESGDRVRMTPGEVIHAGVGSCGVLIPPVEHHQIANATRDVAISLHVYGRNLETCHVFQPLGGDFYRRGIRSLSYHSLIPLSL
ncbi:MAG TPA: cysteine dioxygenase family protein [Candidatus Polarisedimenticolia bacterium]|jgi:predicted metal-dependent enzyme (double-stranded beta helix superfamily)|nr:cysteine dioxygenase family protein [Candidatus Polarisedimenticolia bacterium]